MEREGRGRDKKKEEEKRVEGEMKTKRGGQRGRKGETTGAATPACSGEWWALILTRPTSSTVPDTVQAPVNEKRQEDSCLSSPRSPQSG